MSEDKDLSSKYINFDIGSEAYQIFLYENYVKLYNNLNRIKQLQLFTIDSYYVDFIGNQWFLYKPKYKSFNNTTESYKIYNCDGMSNDINLDDVKSSEKYEEFDDVSGEIWLRLNNFPFAYPMEVNTKCIIKTQLWKPVLNGKIYKFNIFENFGYIYYNLNNTNYIMFFLIEETYQKDLHYFDEEAKTTVLDNFINEDYLNKEVPSINKRILIDPLKSFRFKTTETLIDVVPYNGKFYVLYHDKTLAETNSIKLTSVDSSDSGIITNIVETSTINLPKYDINGNNVCMPNSKTRWSVSMSADNINIAYESIPLMQNV